MFHPIRSESERSRDEVLQWSTAMRQGRPWLPIGIVIPPEPYLLRKVIASGISVEPLLIPEDLSDGRVGTALLNDLRDASTGSVILPLAPLSVPAESHPFRCGVNQNGGGAETMKATMATILDRRLLHEPRLQDCPNRHGRGTMRGQSFSGQASQVYGIF